MIKYDTWMENSNTKFCVKFTCNANDVSYGGYTHKGNGGTNRLGIWEGVKITNVRYKGEDGVWRNNGTNQEVWLSASKNGVVLEVESVVQIWTMGYPGRSYPFFYFGNYSGKRKKYMYGYFSDSVPKTPDNFKSAYAKVPSDWSLVYNGWNPPGQGLTGHWAYKHAMQSGGETWNEGCYEYRNGTNSNGANGWTSEAGRKPQETRRNCFWVFEKKFYSKVTSSGITHAPNTPQITVEYAKGDSGVVRIKHTSPNGLGAWIKLCTLNTRTGFIGQPADFDNWTWLDHEAEHRWEINFNDNCGGENGRGSDIKYYAWAKAPGGYLSNNQLNPYEIPSHLWVGVHRFNGRPSVPNGLRVIGRDNIYYDKTTFTWNAASDPDYDTIVYDVLIKAIHPNGTKIFDEIVATKHNSTSYDYDISRFAEGTKIIYQVRSNDNRIESNWSYEISIVKGEGAKAADTIYPIANSTLYNKRPRILIGTGSFDGSENQTVKVKWNNVWYDNINNSDLFSNRPGNSKTIVFRPPNDAAIGTCTYSVKLNNVYADSPEVVITFNISNTPYTTSDINPYVKINKQHLIALREAVNNIRKAYGKQAINFEENFSFIKLTHYLEIVKGLSDVNDAINAFDPNYIFDISLVLKTDASYITDKEWDDIVEALILI